MFLARREFRGSDPRMFQVSAVGRRKIDRSRIRYVAPREWPERESNPDTRIGDPHVKRDAHLPFGKAAGETMAGLPGRFTSSSCRP